jgi:hypothetical protein
MEPECSLLCLQEPATGPYPELVNPVLSLKSYFFKIHFNIMLPSKGANTEADQTGPAWPFGTLTTG